MNDTPLRAAATRCAGRLARTRISRHGIPWFARRYGVNLEEANAPAAGFGSLQEFFTRSLRPGARPTDPRARALLSPADGQVGECGAISADTLVQAKGKEYSLAALLQEPGERFHGGIFATVYLAPGDYHRFHAPVDGTITTVRRVPGTYYSVNPASVERVPRLFARNERAVVLLDGVALVLVGACLVGGIHLIFRPPSAVTRGTELGWFEFGSTAIVLAEGAWELQVTPGARIRVGEALALRAQSG